MLNTFFPQGKTWEIECWNEQRRNWDRLDLDFTDTNHKVAVTYGPASAGEIFKEAYWDANIIQSTTNQDVLDWINKHSKKTAPLALACDTNLLLRGYIRNLFNDLPLASPYIENIPMVLLTRTIHKEFHAMTGSKLKGDHHTNHRKIFRELFDHDPMIALLLVRTTEKSKYDQKLQELHTQRGRRGIKGQLEIKNLYKMFENKVLMIKPTQLLQAPVPRYLNPFQSLIENDPEFVEKLYTSIFDADRETQNDLLDSVIREEVDFFKSQTNCQVLFLTADKQQDVSSDLEQLEHIYVERPNEAVDSAIYTRKEFKERNLVNLIIALTRHYPVVKVTKEKQVKYFTLSWAGRTQEDMLNSAMLMVDYEQQTTKVDPLN